MPPHITWLNCTHVTVPGRTERLVLSNCVTTFEVIQHRTSVTGGTHTHIHEYLHHIHTACIPYGRKLLREKTFANFAVLWPFMKVFSVKFGNMASFGAAQASNLRKFSPQKLYFLPICESFLCKNYIFYQFAKVFSLKSFLLYGT